MPTRALSVLYGEAIGIRLLAGRATVWRQGQSGRSEGGSGGRGSDPRPPGCANLGLRFDLDRLDDRLKLSLLL